MQNIKQEDKLHYLPKTLALQTTFRNFFSVAAKFKENEIVEESIFVESILGEEGKKESYNKKLWSSLIKLLEDTLKELELIVVSVGPGAYTSTRIGTTIAKAIAYAKNIDVKGVSNLEAMAYQAPPGRIISILDTKRNEIYCEVFEKKEKDLKKISSSILKLDDLKDTLINTRAEHIVFPPWLNLSFCSVNSVKADISASSLLKFANYKLSKKEEFLPICPLYAYPAVNK